MVEAGGATVDGGGGKVGGTVLAVVVVRLLVVVVTAAVAGGAVVAAAAVVVVAGLAVVLVVCTSEVVVVGSMIWAPAGCIVATAATSASAGAQRAAVGLRVGSTAVSMAPRSGTVGTMPMYLMFSTLGPDGAQTLRENPERLKAVNADVERLGVKVLQQFALLGPYDFCNILEAPDEVTMAKVALILGSRGTVKTMTMTAVPVDDYIAALRSDSGTKPANAE